MRTQSRQARYRGRFAPSPTGPLHFGSLVAAVASWCDARAAGGEWLVRIEDLDRAREVAGAAEEILRTLDICGLHWDGPVVYQSARDARYAEALAHLQERGHVYACACTRREIADSALLGIEGLVYPGTCRDGLPAGRAPRAQRLRTAGVSIELTDAVQGRLTQDVEREIGDFVLLRADGLFAYQLAVVIDDAEQGITHVVRGADLLLSTPRQMYLQRLLALPTPEYMHVPIAVDARGEKLSKQTRARAIDPRHAARVIRRVLDFLGQPAPSESSSATSRELLEWATTHWDHTRVPRTRAAAAPPES